MSQTSTLWYASTAGCESFDGPTRQRSHQYGECRPWAWWKPVGSSPAELQPALQRGTPVDADVAAGRVVVLVRERPVDGLGPAAGHGHRHGAARAQDAGQLAHGRGVVGNVLEHLRRDHPVEGPVGEGQRQGVALDRRRRVVRRRSPPPRSWRRRCRAPAPLPRGRRRAPPPTRRAGPPRRHGGRTRSRGRARGRPGPTPSRS